MWHTAVSGRCGMTTATRSPRFTPRWTQCLTRVSTALQHAPHDGFQAALDDAATPVLALIERDPDLAIFQVLRHEGAEAVAYGVRRSLNSAITAFLVAQRLGWEAPM